MFPEKVKLNTSLSPPLDLLSWRTMAITNAFSCSSRNTCSAKGLSQLSAGYCEGWFPPVELHWCSSLQRWDQLATQTGRRETFCTIAVVWKYPNVTRDGNLDLFLFSSFSCSAQDSHILSINYSLMSSLLIARAGGQHVHSAHRDGPLQAALTCVQVLVLAMHLSNQNLVRSILQWAMPQSYKTCFSFQINLWFIFSKPVP